MIVHVPNVLNVEQLARCREIMKRASWIDGRVTAGHQSAQAKDNRQIPEGHQVARELGAMILQALQRHPLFVSAALPLHIFPPLFNRYSGGQSFGNHVDNAVRQVPGTPHRIRTDLSCTLFFTGPEEYDGGELVVEDTYGAHSVKLPAGHLVLYPSTSLHHVRPVTRGTRVCSFFWLQSMVRSNADRALLFDLDSAIRGLPQTPEAHPSAVQLTGVYHNLLRRWVEM